MELMEEVPGILNGLLLMLLIATLLAEFWMAALGVLGALVLVQLFDRWV